MRELDFPGQLFETERDDYGLCEAIDARHRNGVLEVRLPVTQ